LARLITEMVITEPVLVVPITETVDPMRTNDLIDSELPSWRVSKTDMKPAKRQKPRTLMELPN
jgi:hypothetical protein